MSGSIPKASNLIWILVPIIGAEILTLFPIDPEKDNICDVVRRWADIQGDATAFLEPGKETLSYSQLVAVMPIG